MIKILSPNFDQNLSSDFYPNPCQKKGKMRTEIGLDEKIRTEWGQELDFLRHKVVNERTRTKLGQFGDNS